MKIKFQFKFFSVLQNKARARGEKERERETGSENFRLCKLRAEKVYESIKFHKMWAWQIA